MVTGQHAPVTCVHYDVSLAWEWGGAFVSTRQSGRELSRSLPTSPTYQPALTLPQKKKCLKRRSICRCLFMWWCSTAFFNLMQVKCDLCVRTSTYTVQSCWEILLFASAPSCLVHCCFFSSARCIYSGSMIDSMEAKQRILLKFACRQKSNQKRLLCVFLCCVRQQISAYRF